MSTVTALSTWRVVNGRNEMAIALDYPGEWSNTDIRYDGKARGSFVANGVISDAQYVTLQADTRYPLNPVCPQAGAKYFPTQATLDAQLADQTVKGGDAVVLKGTYTGDFTCTMNGDAAHPIILDGTQATINGTLHMQNGGSYVRVLGLEVMYSDWTTRLSTDTHYPPTDIPDASAQSGAVQLHMPNVQLINMRVHDNRLGCGNWKSAVNALIYGALHYHNGWFADNGAPHHGEGVYCENDLPTKIIQKSMMWCNFDHSIAIYGTLGHTDHFQLLDNILFNDEIQLGGNQPLTDLVLNRNAIYCTQDMVVGFGWAGTEIQHLDVHILNNIISGPADQYRLLWFHHWDFVEFKYNTVVGNEFSYPVYMTSLPTAADWDYNTYYYVERTPDLPGKPFYVEGVGELDFVQWKTLTGYDAHSTLTLGLPKANNVIVHLNDYDTRRAHVAIYNWTNALTVNVDLSGLPAGSYRAFNVQNFAEYFDFTAGAAVSFRMTGWTASKPIGHNAPIEKLTFPQFGAFLVVGL